MYILNLKTTEIIDHFREDFYNKSYPYLILSTSNELKLLKDILDIDEITFNDCLRFDENVKFDLFDNYDFLSINTCELNDNKAKIEEINMYLSDNFTLVICEKDNFLYNYVKNMILNNSKTKKYYNNENLFKISYLIIKNIIIHEFENLEKVEDMILNLEDEIMEDRSDEHILKINYIRNITRVLVKNTRPLLYLGDRIIKDNLRYLKYNDMKRSNLDNLQSIDFGIDKLYNFALSTRELADKLLDIYSSKVAEQTNDIITKLTLLTAISAPLTIITGIYGMNFKFMPELNLYYGYPLTLGIMFIIILCGLIIFKIKKLL
nr:CorA family divalent cation transporter [uncultured Romboutsia sp.]